MNKVVGDLIKVVKQNPGSVLVHGCNCFHTMQAGVALEVKRSFPEAYQADLDTKYGDPFKLGDYSSVDTHNGTTIINAYTQFDLGNGIQVDYGAMRKVFKKLKEEFSDRKIFYPKIGSGLGGGDWVIIKGIIEQELEGCDHTLVIWEFDPEAFL